MDTPSSGRLYGGTTIAEVGPSTHSDSSARGPAAPPMVCDRQGVKNHLALPCYNRADGVVQGQVAATHLGVESTCGKATETVTYQAADGTVVPGAKALPGGGQQFTPGLGKVVPLGAKP